MKQTVPSDAQHIRKSSGAERVEYEQTEHYAATKYFLENRDKMLRECLRNEDDGTRSRDEV